MDEFVVYILFSEKYGKTYVGFTSNLIERFNTKNFRPWKVLHIEFFNNKSDALAREKYLKTGKGREFIKGLIFA